MAGFEVTPYGRFCLTPEGPNCSETVLPVAVALHIKDLSSKYSEAGRRPDFIEP
jgi:hypothetical protein